jgi:hypothetical protein
MISAVVIRAEPDMCALCGVLADENGWDQVGPLSDVTDAASRLKRRMRSERVALGNRLLCRFGLRLADWQGQRYVLSRRTGATTIVPGLRDLWSVAERLAGRDIDPLDPVWLDELERGR